MIIAFLFYIDKDGGTKYINTTTTDTIYKTVTLPRVTDTIDLTKFKTRVLKEYVLDSK